MLVDKKGYQGIIKQLSSVMVKFIFYEGKGGGVVAMRIAAILTRRQWDFLILI